MSYSKAMKFARNHPKGIKQMNMGFNMSGITSDEIKEREKKFNDEMNSKTQQERQSYWDNALEMQKEWNNSWPWEWCVFQRNFVSSKNEVR
jgi:hypothetical protein